MIYNIYYIILSAQNSLNITPAKKINEVKMPFVATSYLSSFIFIVFILFFKYGLEYCILDLFLKSFFFKTIPKINPQNKKKIYIFFIKLESTLK